jgi:hypothetical protein
VKIISIHQRKALPLKLSFIRTVQTAIMEVPDLADLRLWYKLTGGDLSPVGKFIVRKPLTESQRRKLPEDLRWRVAA